MPKYQPGQEIENTQTFRQAILHTLSKLNDPHTQAKAEEEFVEICKLYGQSIERIHLVINLLGDQSQLDHNSRLSTKKQYIKLYGLAAEVYGFKILEFFPKILQNLNKKLKEQDNSLHQAIGDCFGLLLEFSLKELTPQEALPFVTQVLMFIFTNLSDKSKQLQAGSAIALSKVIQSCPLEVLYELSNEIVKKINDCYQNTQFKAQNHLLEALLSLLVGIEDKFNPYCQIIMPLIIGSMTDSQWAVRKISVDIIYTIAILMPQELIPFQRQCIEILNQSRFDKIKHVRDASIIALNVLKEQNQQFQNEQEESFSQSRVSQQISENFFNENQIQKQQNFNQNQYMNDPQEEFIDKIEQPKQDYDQIQSSYKQNQNQNHNQINNQKSPQPVRKRNISPFRNQYKKPELKENKSIFQGPRNTDFFKNFSKHDDGIQIVVDQNLEKKQQEVKERQEKQEQNKPTKNQQNSIQKEEPKQIIQNSSSGQKKQDHFQQNQQINPQYQEKDSNFPDFLKNNQENQYQYNKNDQNNFNKNNDIIQSPQQPQEQEYKQQRNSSNKKNSNQQQSIDFILRQNQQILQNQEDIINNYQRMEQEHKKEILSLNQKVQILEDLVDKLCKIAQQQQQQQNFPNNNFQNQNQNQPFLQQFKDIYYNKNKNSNKKNNNNNNFSPPNNFNLFYQNQNQPIQQFEPNNKNNDKFLDSISFQPSELIQQNMKMQKQQLENIQKLEENSKTKLNNQKIQNFNLNSNLNQNLNENQSENQNQNQILNYQQNQNFNYNLGKPQTFNNNYMMEERRFSPHKNLLDDQKIHIYNNNDHNLREESESNLNQKIQKAINDDKLNDAYSMALTSNNDKFLLQLMEQTGICLEKLDKTNNEYLITKLKSFLFKFQNANEVLPWIYNGLIQQNLNLSPILIRSTIETVKRLLDQNSSTHFLSQNNVILSQKIISHFQQ